MCSEPGKLVIGSHVSSLSRGKSRHPIRNSRRCSFVMTRGIEVRVLDDVKVCSLVGSGCESFYRGQMHGICGWELHIYHWVSTLVMGNFIYRWVITLVMGNLMGRRFG
jgi:hypothetical protein